MPVANPSLRRLTVGHLLGSFRRLPIVALIAGAMFVIAPAATLADTYGPCEVSASVGGSTTDIAAMTTWQISSTDRPILRMVAPFEIQPVSEFGSTQPRRYYWLAGLGVQAVKGDAGSVPGTTGALDFGLERLLGARFNLNWGINGPESGDQCSWSSVVTLADVNPLLTVFGGGALLLALVALLAIVGSTRVKGRWWLRIGLGVLGAIGGFAAESSLEQFAVVPWKSGFLLGIGLALIGLVAGLTLLGLAHRANPDARPPAGTPLR